MLHMPVWSRLPPNGGLRFRRSMGQPAVAGRYPDAVGTDAAVRRARVHSVWQRRRIYRCQLCAGCEMLPAVRPSSHRAVRGKTGSSRDSPPDWLQNSAAGHCRRNRDVSPRIRRGSRDIRIAPIPAHGQSQPERVPHLARAYRRTRRVRRSAGHRHPREAPLLPSATARLHGCDRSVELAGPPATEH